MADLGGSCGAMDLVMTTIAVLQADSAATDIYSWFVHAYGYLSSW